MHDHVISDKVIPRIAKKSAKIPHHEKLATSPIHTYCMENLKHNRSHFSKLQIRKAYYYITCTVVFVKLFFLFQINDDEVNQADLVKSVWYVVCTKELFVAAVISSIHQ